MRAGRLWSALALAVVVAMVTFGAPFRAQGATAVPQLSIAAATVNEGNSGTTTMTFVVSATATTSVAMTVRYATSDGTAVAPGDYTAKTGSVSIPAGSKTTTITVSVVGDKLYEKNETFTVTLSSPVNATLGTAKSATGTITNDDAVPVVSVGAASVTEGNTGTTPMVFTVTIPAASGLPVTVSYQTANGTAVAPGDFTGGGVGTVTIAAGSLSSTFFVPVVGDVLYEGNETFTVTLSNPVNATLGTATATGTIVDDDTRPTVSVANASATEGNSGTTAMVFTVTSSAVSGLPATVNYQTSDGSAKAPGDYQAKSGTVTIPAGSKTATFSVLVVGDTVPENTETFTVTLSGPVNATLGTATATGTIIDDDPDAVSVASASVTEGNSGTTPMTFTVSMPVASASAVSVHYATSNGTATAPADYTATSGSVTIPAGSTSATFTVLVVGDTLHEANETFTVTLSSPVNATLGTATATGTIVDQDPAPVVSVASTSVPEGNSGTTTARFTVTASAVSGLPVTVSFATSDGTARAPGDYTATTGSVTIPVGSTSATVSVVVIGDTLYEKNETFSLTLSTPVNATLGTATATGTIVDDDPVPVVSISDASQSEGNSGTAPMPFTVSISAVSGLPVTATYTTVNGSAIAPGDYTATTGTVTVPAGSTSAVVNVPIVGDTLYEGNEAFTITLSSPVNATLGVAGATGTILDDDPPPAASVGNASVVEGNSGTTPMIFTVTLSAASALTTKVDYQTADGTATAPDDYIAAGGTVTVPAGSRSATFAVLVVGDLLYEGNETFTVTLSNPVNAILGTASATGTIIDDEPVPGVSIGDVSVTEGDSGTTAAVFPVTLSVPSDFPISVDYATHDGTATAPGDYTPVSSTVTIPAGQTHATITVAVVGDTLHELDETFTVSISDPTPGVTVTRGVATGTIVDDDDPPVASVSDTSVSEGDTGSTVATFTVTLSAVSGLPATVSYSTADGTATAPADYTAASGTVTVPAGSTSATFGVTVNGDTLYETNETFTVSLADPVGVTLGTATATGTIVDDDPAPTVSVADTSVPDGASGTTTTAVFTVTLSAPSGLPATVDYATADGTATGPDDYTTTADTLTIPAGSTAGTISVPVIGGLPHEGDLAFTVTLANPSGATLGSPTTATGTIVDEHRLGLATGATFWRLTQAQQLAQLNDFQSLGAQWIRTTLFWRDVQPSGPGTFDWTNADFIVAAASARHIAVIWQIIGAPSWSVQGAQPGALYDYPTDPTLYATFAAAVAQRYDPQGVTAYELGNSENLVSSSNTPNPAFYTALLCDTHTAIKAVAPDATVLVGGLGGTTEKNGDLSGAHFVQLIYADGAEGCFDAISFHPYTYPLMPPDDGTGGWSAMLNVRQTMVANGDGNLKIWATEFGAPTNGPNSNHVTEAVQAQMLDTGYRLFASYSWAGPMCWFRYDDKGTDPSDQSNFFGLVRFDGSQKPAYSTFATDAAAAIP